VRRLILSDIHSNLEALEAVLRHAHGAYEEIICCGDVVGYCASPVEVTAWTRENARRIVRGNHDRACSGMEDLGWFNPVARSAAEWTMAQLAPGDREWLASLPQGPIDCGSYELAHGSPADEDEYLVNTFEVERLEEQLQRNICFVGHTHVQSAWSWQRGGIQRLPVPKRGEQERICDLDPDYLYLINPGSVGQPRDGDPRAGYAIWDEENGLVYFRRVPYDIPGAQSRILEAGLHRMLAERLSSGR
jgi:diadenosine tetraphosphatase ApaH/serine/threonine PP2A family protein phosphatase